MGTRLAEETDARPKPMVEIGGRPILWHIMKHYSGFGMNEFVIALGYKKEAIIRYFMELHHYGSDLTIRTGDGSVTVHEGRREPDWTVHLIDTGPSIVSPDTVYLATGCILLTSAAFSLSSSSCFCSSGLPLKSIPALTLTQAHDWRNLR